MTVFVDPCVVKGHFISAGATKPEMYASNLDECMSLCRDDIQCTYFSFCSDRYACAKSYTFVSDKTYPVCMYAKLGC